MIEVDIKTLKSCLRMLFGQYLFSLEYLFD